MAAPWQRVSVCEMLGRTAEKNSLLRDREWLHETEHGLNW
jgi:hypothetical protein